MDEKKGVTPATFFYEILGVFWITKKNFTRWQIQQNLFMAK